MLVAASTSAAAESARNRSRGGADVGDGDGGPVGEGACHVELGSCPLQRQAEPAEGAEHSIEVVGCVQAPAGLEDIDEPPGSFDAVFCREGLMFAADPARAATCSTGNDLDWRGDPC
jgi:hypothetical protein